MPTSAVVAAAEMRRKIEENSQPGTDLLGLPQYQVRSRTGRHRHVSTGMLALAGLLRQAVLSAVRVYSKPQT